MKTPLHKDKDEKEIRLRAVEVAVCTVNPPASEGVLLTRAEIISNWILSGKIPRLPQEPS
jgi:hypothetical protein